MHSMLNVKSELLNSNPERCLFLANLLNNEVAKSTYISTIPLHPGFHKQLTCAILRNLLVEWGVPPQKVDEFLPGSLLTQSLTEDIVLSSIPDFDVCIPNKSGGRLEPQYCKTPAEALERYVQEHSDESVDMEMMRNILSKENFETTPPVDANELRTQAESVDEQRCYKVISQGNYLTAHLDEAQCPEEAPVEPASTSNRDPPLTGAAQIPVSISVNAATPHVLDINELQMRARRLRSIVIEVDSIRAKLPRMAPRLEIGLQTLEHLYNSFCSSNDSPEANLKKLCALEDPPDFKRLYSLNSNCWEPLMGRVSVHIEPHLDCISPGLVAKSRRWVANATRKVQLALCQEEIQVLDRLNDDKSLGVKDLESNKQEYLRLHKRRVDLELRIKFSDELGVFEAAWEQRNKRVWTEWSLNAHKDIKRMTIRIIYQPISESNPGQDQRI